MNHRATFAPITLGLTAAGAAAWLVSNRRWGSAATTDDSLPVAKAFVTGADAAPVVTACAFVVLAAGLALLVTGPIGRKIVAVIALMAAGTGAISAATAAAAVERALERQIGVGGTVHLWHWGALALFVVAMVLALATWVTSRDWPTMSSRYEAPGANDSTIEPDSEAEVWKAFDEGADPTE